MANITYRIKPQLETGVAPKGTPLTNLEIDNNFFNIDTEVHEKLDFPASAGIAVSTNGDESSIARSIQVSGNGISIANANGVSGNPSITLASTTNNTPNTLVYRDGNGDFYANTVRANLIAGNVYLDTGEAIIFEGNANDFELTMLVQNPTQDRTLVVPDRSGTLVTTGDTSTVTNTMLAGSIANNKLTNSAVTINGNTVSLGGSVSLSSTNFVWTGTHEFTDSKLTIADDAVPSKKVRFQASLIPSNTTVTLNLPNENGQTLATQNWTNVNLINKTGDTMTGFLTLHANPTSSLHAATKSYVDTKTVLPTTILYKTGGTMTGYLTLNANPTSSLHAATKAYVDSKTATSAYWAGATGNPGATLGVYAAYPTGTLVSMQYNFIETYWAGNGGATRSVTQYLTYIKTASSNSWQLVARV